MKEFMMKVWQIERVLKHC